MLFSIDGDSGAIEQLRESELAEMGFYEQQDLQEWIINEPRILGEDLKIITSEFAGFEDTQERLDLLALDPTGKVVVIELKRDRADRTTDLQAVKYASYCSTLTAEDLQKEYRDFWNDREEVSYSPEEVGEEFESFLSECEEDVGIGTEGWAVFDLDQKPRIILAAGSFGLEVTAPVMWLIEEYGLEITCTKIEPYEHQDKVLLNTQQVIPVPEAEEYMTRRRQKEIDQESQAPRTTLEILREKERLQAGDSVQFNPDKVPTESAREWDKDDDFWWATVTDKTGQQNNVRWHHDDTEYSFTGLSKELLNTIVGRDKNESLNGYKFWCHPAYEGQTLYDLRSADLTQRDGTENPSATAPE